MTIDGGFPNCSSIIQGASSKTQIGENTMATNGITAQVSPKTSRRRNFFISNLMFRIIIALVISWLIVMAFFITNVISH